jgi:putative protein kinase ArgK-like GTPase of G3E family
MKFNYKVNLGNIAGAIANIAPEVTNKIDLKSLNDITIEGSAEYTVTEAVAMISEFKKFAVELPDIIGTVALKFRELQEIFDDMEEEECECDNCCDDSVIVCIDGEPRELSVQEAFNVMNDVVDKQTEHINDLQGQVKYWKSKAYKSNPKDKKEVRR